MCVIRLRENFLSLLFYEEVLLMKRRLSSDILYYTILYPILYAIYIERSRSRIVDSSIIKR